MNKLHKGYISKSYFFMKISAFCCCAITGMYKSCEKAIDIS